MRRMCRDLERRDSNAWIGDFNAPSTEIPGVKIPTLRAEISMSGRSLGSQSSSIDQLINRLAGRSSLIDQLID